MKRTTTGTCLIAAFVTSLILVTDCQKENTGIVVRKQKLTGVVQKGPFVDASISLYELKPTLAQTGKSYSTQISGETGSFEIDNVALTLQYVELKANGYYFNEVSGAIASYHLTLGAISDIKDLSIVNVNLITHLENERVKYLVEKGSSFTEAKDTAQKEVLSIFGFTLTDKDNSENLDISANNDGNAILLAVSVILQGDRGVRELTELLGDISTDLRQDGKLDDETIIAKLRNSALTLDPVKVRSNLENRYLELGISASIPDFEKYINVFLSYTGLAPSTETLSAGNITPFGATLKGTVKANDLATSVIFEYGTTSLYGNTIPASPETVNGHSFITVSAELTGLNPATTYHFRIKAVNRIGTMVGSDLTFTTLGKLPAAETKAATSISGECANLNGTVNANELETTVIFEYGTDEKYGSLIPATPEHISGGAINNITAILSGLNPRTIYHFRIKAVNLLGATYGKDFSFTTPGSLPSATTNFASPISTGSATLNGMVNANWFSSVVTFDYGESNSYSNEITADQSPVIGNDNTSVSATLSRLIPGTIYHFRIKAVNSVGTSYGKDLTFTATPEPVSDADGNLYKAVSLGEQVWLAQNLKTTRYNDNTPISLVTVDDNWDSRYSPAYCWYNNDELANKRVYGALYNWYVLDNQRNGGKNVCPVGWHAPSINEWRILINYIGGEQSGKKLMETGTSHWDPPNSDATNETGFTALPGGYRLPSGSFYYLKTEADFLTSSSEYYNLYVYKIRLSLTGSKVWIDKSENANLGASIRCIMDK